MKVKKGDTVLIITGKERSKQGKIVRVLPRESRIVVEGVAVRRKHVRPRRANQQGQVVEMPSPISVSNVKLVCSKCGKAVRVGHRIEGKRKVRICKKCSAEL